MRLYRRLGEAVPSALMDLYEEATGRRPAGGLFPAAEEEEEEAGAGGRAAGRSAEGP